MLMLRSGKNQHYSSNKGHVIATKKKEIQMSDLHWQRLLHGAVLASLQSPGTLGAHCLDNPSEGQQPCNTGYE